MALPDIYTLQMTLFLYCQIIPTKLSNQQSCWNSTSFMFQYF